MKKVIILSCSTGQGHNSCAQAVQDYFQLQNVPCEIREALDFVSPGFARFMSWGHSFVYRHLPGLFQWGYQYSDNHPGVLGRGSGVYSLLISGADRMGQYLADGGYDTVICTHVFAGMILSHALRKHPLPVQTAFIATDYTCYPCTELCEVDRYFIPCGELTETYVSRGIPRERIVPAGIPVRRSFWAGSENAKEQLGLDPKRSHLLVMCGSMGCGPLVRILQQLRHLLPEEAEATVICGSNRRLYNKLSRLCQGDPRLHVVGYTQQVPLYMDASQLYLTKPGGISVTEAAAKHLPMAFVNAVAGCEQFNMDFFTHMGAALTASTPEALAQESVRVLQDCTARQRMEEALLRYDQPDGARRIFEELSGESVLCGKTTL